MADLQTTGKINQIKGRIRSAWGDVTDDDVDRAGGDLSRLIGVIQKTGDSMDDIKRKLAELEAEEDPRR